MSKEIKDRLQYEKEKIDFDIEKNDVVAITGAGGKTSLMYYLAEKLSSLGKVLVTTTTKIYKPEKTYYGKLITGDKIQEGQGKDIDLIATEEIDGKLIGLAYEKIEELRKDYDYVLIEADGAGERPMKGWKADEPLIPPFATITIGVVNIRSLGNSIDEKNIHRLKIFGKETGTDIESESVVTPDILKRYIEKGCFHRGSKGRNIFYLNAVEKEKDFEKAVQLGYGIENFYFGSIHDKWTSRMKKLSAVVMASGYSSRFGADDKLLAEVNGKPCIENLFIELKELYFNEVIVVGRTEKVKELADKYGYRYVDNKNAHLGQSESVKLGIKSSSGDAVAFFPGDQPYLRKKQVLKIVERYQKTDEITMPIVEGKPDTPVVFPVRYRRDLLLLKGDTGGREVIRKNHREEVRFEEGKNFKDIDKPEDI